MPYKPPSYREYLAAVRAAGDAVNENLHLHKRIGELERRLTAAELTSMQIYELGTARLEELAHHHYRLVTQIVAELRKRHHDVSDALIAPQVRAVEQERDEVKRLAWDARDRAHDLEQENSRLMAALEKLADVTDAQPASEQEVATPHV
jgi:hypothetical protein